MKQKNRYSAFGPNSVFRSETIFPQFPILLPAIYVEKCNAITPFRSSIRTTKQSGNDLTKLVLTNSIQSGADWNGSKEVKSSEKSYNYNRAIEL